MNPSGNDILVGTVGQQVYVRVSGKGTHLNSQSFREFSFEMLRRGFDQFQLDLGACTYMDSTFLGVLVGVSLRLKKAPHGRFVIVRATDRHIELLRTLGVDQLFEIKSDGATAKPSDLSALAPAESSIRQKAETMLEAHESLVKADERNAPRFKDVIQFLKEDLARMDSADPSADSKPKS